MQIGTMHPKTNHVGNQLGPSALGTTTMQSPIPHKADGDHILRPQSVPLEHDAGIGQGHPRIGRLPRVETSNTTSQQNRQTYHTNTLTQDDTG